MRALEININNITYAELANALHQLGFKKVADADHFKYLHTGSGAKVLLGKGKGNDQVYTPYIAGIATVLEGFNIIKEAPDFWKMIEANRLQQKAAA